MRGFVIYLTCFLNSTRCTVSDYRISTKNAIQFKITLWKIYEVSIISWTRKYLEERDWGWSKIPPCTNTGTNWGKL